MDIRNKINASTGMTLIELMIVVAILAIITSIAVPLYSNYISGARNTECQNNLAAIRLAEEEFFLDNNDYFNGANVAALASFWQPSEANANRNFDYSVASTTTSWTATCVGRGGGFAVPATTSFTISNAP